MPKNNTQQNSLIQQLESLISSSLDVIFRISPTGKINFISPSSTELLGYLPEEMLGKSILEFISTQRVNDYFNEISILFKKSSLITFKIELISKSGEIIPVEITGRVVQIDGKPMGQGTIRDIRQRIETQKKLSSSENIFKALWENSKDGMRLTDEDGVIILCNKAFADLIQKPFNELINRPISELYQDQNHEYVIEKYKQNFIQGAVKDFYETSANLWNGLKLYFEVSNSIIQDGTGKRFLVSIFRDIGERKVNEDLLSKKGRLLQGIAKATNALITDSEYIDGFNTALRFLGEAAEADRVYIYRHMEDLSLIHI